MDIKIRQVAPGDVERCFEIESVCFAKDEAATRDKIRQRQTLFPAGFLVAEAHGRIVGFINSCASHDEDLADEAIKDLVGHDPVGPNMVILSVAVHPDHQGRGVSSALMTGFVERSRSLGKKKILLLCKQDMIGYYRHFGFYAAGVSASQHGGARWHEMRLTL